MSVTNELGGASGSGYVPALKTKDSPVGGRVTRVLGRTTGRVHHLLNDHQTAVFYELDWHDLVVDIREHFRLSKTLTRAACAALGVELCESSGTKLPKMFITDFLVTLLAREGEQLLAIAAPRTKGCHCQATLNRLAVQKEYWSARQVPFVVWRETKLEKTRAQNLAFLHEYHSADRWSAEAPQYWKKLTDELLTVANRLPPPTTLQSLFIHFDSTSGRPAGSAIQAYRYLASKKLIPFDLNRTFVPTQVVLDLSNGNKLDLSRAQS